MTDMTHDQLAHSLAMHLRADNRMIWEDILSGPSGSVRPDVFVMEKSWANPNPISYEIKVSKSDFLSDVTKAKWQNYLAFSYGVVFAVPKGLISRKEIPQSCGLIQFNGVSWHTIKRPTLQPCTIDSDMLLKLLMDGDRLLSKPKPIQNRDFDQWKHMDALRLKFGKDAAEKIHFIEQYPAMKKELRALKKEIAEILDMNDLDRWGFVRNARYHINNIKVMADETERKKAIAEELGQLANTVTMGMKRISDKYTQ